MNDRTSITMHCSIAAYYAHIELARSMPSYFSHGWIPGNFSDFTRVENPLGMAYFTFTKKSDAMLFKLASKTG